MLSWITKIKLEVMTNRAMFATISPFLVIYDNTTKANINLQKLTRLEPLTLAWMLTIIQTPPRSNFPLFWYSLPMLAHSLPLPTLEPLACFGPTFSPFGIKSPKSPKQKGLQGNYQVLANIAQREMLNTWDKAAWTMIHMYDINEDTTCENN
jgi:hypothetical protein